MSMSAALGLMSKLASSVANCTSLSAFSNALKSGAKQNLYALKVDSGEKKDWLIVQANTGENPTIVDPNDQNAQSPKVFDSIAAANAYKTANDLKYTYPNGNVSTISSFELMKYTSNSDANVTKMADGTQGLEGGLSKVCNDEYLQKQTLTPPRLPTVAEYLAKIKQKMMEFL